MQKLLFAKILATIPSKAKKYLSIYQKVHKKVCNKKLFAQSISVSKCEKTFSQKCLLIFSKIA